MDFKLPKIFAKADAKSRVFIVASIVIVVGFLIYFLAKFLGGGPTTGNSRVAGAPANFQSVPGAKNISPEFYRTAVQANKDAAAQAQISGTSAVPTLLNVTSNNGFGTTNCAQSCPDGENADVSNDINDLIRTGKIAQEDGEALNALAKRNVPVSEYASTLDDLVKTGKITPEEARRLLKTYTAQHTNASVAQSANIMDGLIKSGRLPISVAAELLGLQKQKVSPTEYAAYLNRLVKEGKLTPDLANQLLAQYTQQKNQEAAQESSAALQQMVKSNAITQDVADDLSSYHKRNAPVSQYAAELSRLVAAGKLSPQIAAKLLAEYEQQRANTTSTGMLNKLVEDASAAATAGVNNLIGQGKLTQAEADQLLALQSANVSPAEYEAALNRLVRSGKLTTAEAERLMSDYNRTQGLEGALSNLVGQGKLNQTEAAQLLALQKAGATAGEYRAALDKLVQAGKISADEAQRLADVYGQPQTGNTLKNLVAQGKLADADFNTLNGLKNAGVSATTYQAALDKLVREGKLSQADAQKLLDEYNAEKGSEDLNSLVKSGKIASEDAQTLMALKNAGVSSDDFRAALDKLVKAGKLTSEEADKLAEAYENSRSGGAINSLISKGKLSAEDGAMLNSLKTSGVTASTYRAALDKLVQSGKLSEADAQKLMDDFNQNNGNPEISTLVEKGKLSSEDARTLTALKAAGASPDEYKAALDKMVQQGKLSADDAQELMKHFNKTSPFEGTLTNLVNRGKLSTTDANDLLALKNANVSPEEYKAALDKLVQDGKISQTDADRILQQYLKSGGLKLEIAKLANAGKGKLSDADSKKLLDLQRANATPQEYQDALTQLVQAGKISPAEADRLMAQYQKLNAVKDLAQRLTQMQANNASVSDYADELRRASAAGLISPEVAARLLQEYQTTVAANTTTSFTLPASGDTPAGTAPAVDTSVAGNDDFARLQQRLAQQKANQSPTATGDNTQQQFEAAAAQAAAEAQARRQQAIQDRMSAMSNQAQSLIASWQPPTMQHKGGDAGDKKNLLDLGNRSMMQGQNSAGAPAPGSPPSPPLIKAGTIIFAVLDTAVDSDYPNTPVMATIVSGKFKGSKLLGKLQLEQGQDRVSLSFTLMDNDDWERTKNISAFAIDPETARSVMATSINHHYLMRYGSMMASSFLTGYANAISQAGSVDTTSIAGISTTHGPLSPGQKLAVGLGQVGNTVGAAVANYFNTPTTVRVKAGVGIGILFMNDVEDQPVLEPTATPANAVAAGATATTPPTSG